MNKAKYLFVVAGLGLSFMCGHEGKRNSIHDVA